MKIVYHAENIIDAQLVRDALEAEGIAVTVSGEHLTAGVGELPFGGLVKVWVDEEHFSQAKQVIKNWESGRSEVEATEDSDQNFDQPTRVNQLTKQSSFFPLLAGTVFGGLLGGVLVYALFVPPKFSDEVDYDQNGIIDERLTVHGDFIEKFETDRNQDGKTDAIWDYVAPGEGSARLDDDFNGSFENTMKIDRGLTTYSSSDFNLDGRPDCVADFAHGLQYYQECFDSSGKLFKKVEWRKDGTSTEQLDLNRDSSFEVKREYDVYGELIAN